MAVKVVGKDMDELLLASAKSLADAIRKKEVSSVEVVDAYIKRIEEVNPCLNAVVQLTAEKAHAQAREMDASVMRGDIKGPLHGVPMTIKDSFDTCGVISTGGTKGREGYVPERDATVVARMRAAGAILLGKTNTPELTLAFETDNLVYGRTNNPYDPSRTPGGSSGGAAAIIAAGGTPIDIGSDMAGSIRLPAHFCGISGIKPTSGRVPRTGHIIPFGMGALDSLTQIGPMARFVEDLITVLPVICGVDYKDPSIIPMPVGCPEKINIKDLSVAVHTDNGRVLPKLEISEAVKAAATALEDAGACVEEDRPAILGTNINIMTADCGWIRRLLKEAGTEEIHPWLNLYFDNEKQTSSFEFMQIMEKWDIFRSEMLSFMESYDVIICPVNISPAIPHGTWLNKENRRGFSYTMTYNLTGWPAAVARAGTSPDGLPIGVQIVGLPWREDVVLAVAGHIETALGGYKPPPI